MGKLIEKQIFKKELEIKKNGLKTREKPSSMTTLAKKEFSKHGLDHLLTEHEKHVETPHPECDICQMSDVDIRYDDDRVYKKIVGLKIVKTKHLKVKDTQDNSSLFVFLPLSDMNADKENILPNSAVSPRSENDKGDTGVIRYSLSNRKFIDKGWTQLPTEKVVRKLNVYRMRPAHPEFNWFEHNKYKGYITYDTGDKFAELDENGCGRWYYRNGNLALKYYNTEEANAEQRYVVYSNGERDERGRSRPLTVLATFDHSGNGVVFDHTGKIRLHYNQTEGVVLDRALGPVSHWKWHSLNDPPVLQQVMIDTQMSHKDPGIIELGLLENEETKPPQDNEEMLAIEYENFIKAKSKKLEIRKFKPFQIKMKALKINEQFSLKILDQTKIYLIFRDGTMNSKLNLGMKLDHQEIIDTDTAELGQVDCPVERFPASTESIADLQHSVLLAQRVERLRAERERRLRPTLSIASVDQMKAAISKPLRAPLYTVSSSTATASAAAKCKYGRKPTCTSLYYNMRLI